MAHLGYWIRYFYFLDYISAQRVHQPDERKNQEIMPPAFESGFFNNRKKIRMGPSLKPFKAQENKLI
jgi:hypothetical protein